MKNAKRIVAGFCSLLIVSLIIANTVTTNASAAVKLATKSIKLTVDQTSKIVIKNKVKKATYTFKSSDKEVATVSKTGVVTGISEGTAKVTVSCKLNKKVSKVGTVKITVEAAEEEPTVAPTATPKPTVAPVDNTALHDEIMKKSLVSTGNNTRIKKAIEKARNGEPVTIAYIGGSITDGAMATPKELCYAYRSYEYFKKTFGKGDGSNVKFINAGLSGTPSTIGMVRYDRDIVKVAGGNPDIVFIEFAVNDGGEATKGEGYESLIRTILKSNNNPAVVLLFSIFKGGYNEQARLQPIGTYYNLPMVSIHDGILPAINAGKMKNEEFFHADGLHPINDGHKLYAEAIDYMYDTIDKETKATSDITIPDAAKIGKGYENILMIDSKTTSSDYTITPGSFKGVDNNIYTSYWDNSHKSFPNNWMHTSANGSDSMKISLTCKSFVVVYKSGDKNTFGKADVYVDGTKKATLDGTQGGSWNNPLPGIIFNDATAAKHEIEIKMASDSSAKNFTVEAFGYTK